MYVQLVIYIYRITYMNINNLNIDKLLEDPQMLQNAVEMLKKNPKILETMASLGNQNVNDNLLDTSYNLNDKVIIENLMKSEFNGKLGIVKDYNKEKERYSVYIEEIDKTVLIKEKNIKINN